MIRFNAFKKMLRTWAFAQSKTEVDLIYGACTPSECSSMQLGGGGWGAPGPSTAPVWPGGGDSNFKCLRLALVDLATTFLSGLRASCHNDPCSGYI